MEFHYGMASSIINTEICHFSSAVPLEANLSHVLSELKHGNQNRPGKLQVAPPRPFKIKSKNCVACCSGQGEIVKVHDENNLDKLSK